MKKSIIIILITTCLIFITGCTDKVEKIESKNDKVNKNILEIVENKGEIEQLQLIDENILLTSLGLTTNQVDDYIGKIPVYNSPSSYMYIAIKPKKGSEDSVRRALDLYVSDLENKLSQTKIDEKTGEQKIIETQSSKQIKNMLKKEYKGYYIYISSNENDEIFKILKKII